MPQVLPLTVLAGLDRPAVADLVAGLLLRVPRLAAVWADPFTAELGYVQTRVTDSDGRCTERAVELEHGCLSCAMREGVVRAILGLARTGRYDSILIHLHPGIEADAAVPALHAALAGRAVVDTVVTVLHPDWLDHLAGDATTADRGIAVAADDDRSAATVLAADLDAATVLVLPGAVGAAASADERGALTVLAPDTLRLNPATTLDVHPRDVLHTATFDPDSRDLFARRGLLDPELTLPQPAGGLRLVRWSARRPVHPARLHTALDHLADGIIRSAGYLWLATRPELVLGWNSAGDCLHLGPHSLWLTPAPGHDSAPCATAEPSIAQRQHAHRTQHPYYGDRVNWLGFLGDDLDEEHIRRVLSECLLTDAELAAGVEGWRRLDDPFPDWSDAVVTAPAEDATPDHTSHEASTETNTDQGAA